MQLLLNLCPIFNLCLSCNKVAHPATMSRYQAYKYLNDDSNKIPSHGSTSGERYRDDEETGNIASTSSSSSDIEMEKRRFLANDMKMPDIESDTLRHGLYKLLTSPFTKTLAVVSLLMVSVAGFYAWFKVVTVSSSFSHTTSVQLSHTPTDNPAFLSFLAPNWHDDPDTTDWYFVSLRMLGYQLMHAENSKSRYPFLVAVTKGVNDDKRRQLEQDGAIIIELPEIHVSAYSEWGQFRDVMGKLSLFGLYGEYGRFCFIDADTMVLENMDGIFEDPATQIRNVLTYPDEIKDDEPPLPSTYLFASHAEVTGHHWDRVKRTQDPASGDYLNAGFYIFAPGPAIHQYYMWLANHTDRYDPVFPEQNLYNYAHRRPGNMPWTRIQDDWNVFRGGEIDILRGVKSFHSHAWESDWAGHSVWQEKFDEMTWFYGNRSEASGVSSE